MSDLLFDAPWWVPLFIAAVGVALFVSANRRANGRLRLVGGGVVCLALLVVVFKFAVDTPKKATERMSRELVAAVVSGDSAKFQSLLEPHATLRVLSFRPLYTDAEQVTRAAKEEASRIHLRAAHVHGVVVEKTGTLITVSLDVGSEQDEGAPFVDSSWQFDFEEVSAGWRIREIRAIRIGGLGTDQIESELPRR